MAGWGGGVSLDNGAVSLEIENPATWAGLYEAKT